jgi:hypothetical protein
MSLDKSEGVVEAKIFRQGTTESDAQEFKLCRNLIAKFHYRG